MIWNPAKLVALLVCLLFWIFIAFIIVGCANTSQIANNQRRWYPIGMSEDAQDFNNSNINNINENNKIGAKILSLEY